MKGSTLAGLSLAITSMVFAGTEASAGGWRDCRHGGYAGYAPAYRYEVPPVYYPGRVVYFVPAPAYYAPPPVAYSYYGPAGPIRYYVAPRAYGYAVRPQLFDGYYNRVRWRRW